MAKTFKPMPEEESSAPDKPLPVGDKQAIIDNLLRVEGMNQELAEHMIKHGVVDDSYVVQTAYRVSAVTADTVIKVFQEMTK